MPDHVDVRILDRLDDPGRDPGPRLGLPVVQARHDPVGLFEHVVGQVQSALLEHVDLDPLEHDDRRTPLFGERFVEPVDLPPLPQQSFLVEPAGHRHPLPVVGDGDVLEPTGDRGPDHLAERALTVGGGGVHVEVAADVGHLHERGQLPPFRQRDLAAPLAEFRGNPGQADRLVDLVLGPAGHAGTLRWARRVVASRHDPVDAVLVDCQPPVAGAGPQPHVVLLRSGEILQGGPE